MFRSFLKVVGNVWKLPGLFWKSQSWPRKNLMHLTQKKLAGIHSLYTSCSSQVWISNCIQSLAKMFWIHLNIAKIVLEASEQKIFGYCGHLEQLSKMDIILPIYKQQNNGIPIIVSINKWPCCFSQVFMNIAFNTKGWWKVSDTSIGEVGY